MRSRARGRGYAIRRLESFSQLGGQSPATRKRSRD